MTETPENNGNIPQCQYFVVRKKRLCRMTVRPGRNYCGEHEPQPKTEHGEVDKRIPCPLDPKHTCYASKLEKHLSICNARRTDNPPYIVWNVNAPPQDEVPRRPLSQYPRDLVQRVVIKVNELYEKHIEGNILDIPETPIPPCMRNEFNESGRTETSRRHLRQAAALLRLAEQAGMVRDRSCYVELGAGKGQLSYYMGVSWCGPDTGSCVLAVDRAAMRHKKDAKLRPPRGASERGKVPNETIEKNIVRQGANEKIRTGISETEIVSQVESEKGRVPRNNEREIVRQGASEREIVRQGESKMEIVTQVANERGIKMQLGENEIEIVRQGEGEILRTRESETELVRQREIEREKVKKDDNETDEILRGEEKIVRQEESKKRILRQGENERATLQLKDRKRKIVSQSETELPQEVECEREIVYRLRADLRHVVLEHAPAVETRAALVGVAKHLCGVATDYALRCVVGVGRARGLVLATCCHHRCEQRDFFANEQLQELGITGEEFNVMLGIVSWATCGDGRSRQRRQQSQQQQHSEQLENHELIDRNHLSSGDFNRKENDKDNLEEPRLKDIEPKTNSDETEEKIDHRQNEEVRIQNQESIRNSDKKEPSLQITRNNNEKEPSLKMTQNNDEKEGTLEMVIEPIELGSYTRVETGRRAKALVDWARCRRLAKDGWTAKLARFVPESVSPENIAILATMD